MCCSIAVVRDVVGHSLSLAVLRSYSWLGECGDHLLRSRELAAVCLGAGHGVSSCVPAEVQRFGGQSA